MATNTMPSIGIRRDSSLSPTPMITPPNTLTPPSTLARRGAIRRSLPRPITLYPTCLPTSNITRNDSISPCRKHRSGRNHNVSTTHPSDASYFSDISPFPNSSPNSSSPGTSSNTTTTTTTPSSDISSSYSDTYPSNITSPDVPSSDAPTDCNCCSILFDALDNGLGGTTSINKALETVRLYGGCDGLKRIIDPVEQLSLCKTCPREEALREFLYLVCNGVIRQYRHFYYALSEYYETVDHRLRLGFRDERERHDYTFMLYVIQLARIIASVDRLNLILPEQSVYDADAWYALANQCEQLVEATGRLREQVVCGDG